MDQDKSIIPNLVNTIVLDTPYKVICDIKDVRFLRREGDALPWGDEFWRTKFQVVVVEAKRGCWLSKITKEYFGDYLSAYDANKIYLYHKALAEFFECRAVVGDEKEPNFPRNLYKKGNVPSSYDEWAFNPDFIYPGQRFILLKPTAYAEPTQIIDFKKPSVIEGNVSWHHSTWFGLSIGQTADVGVVGKHWNVAYLYNLADILAYYKDAIEMEDMRNVLLEMGGWQFSGGWGSSVGLCGALAYGFPKGTDMKKYSPEGWDWDFSLGFGISSLVKSIKSSLKIAGGLKTLKIFKTLTKVITKETAKEMAKDATKELVKDRINTGIIKPLSKQGIFLLPVPFTSVGLHVSISYKYDKVELLEVKDQ